MKKNFQMNQLLKIKSQILKVPKNKLKKFQRKWDFNDKSKEEGLLAKY